MEIYNTKILLIIKLWFMLSLGISEGAIFLQHLQVRICDLIQDVRGFLSAWRHRILLWFLLYAGMCFNAGNHSYRKNE